MSRLEARGDYFIHRFDNHFVPAVDLVPTGSKVFHLEDGFAPVAQWLTTISGRTCEATFGHANKRAHNKVRLGNRYVRFLKRNIQKPIPEQADLSLEIKMRISNLYAADFERFGKMSNPSCASYIEMPSVVPPFSAVPTSSQAA